MSMKTMMYAGGSPASPTPLIEPSVTIKPPFNYQLSSSGSAVEEDDDAYDGTNSDVK